MEDSELAAIEERWRKATGGPWKSYVEGRDHKSGSSFIRTAGNDFELLGATADDQDFIASTHADIPQLIAEIRRLRASVKPTA